MDKKPGASVMRVLTAHARPLSSGTEATADSQQPGQRGGLGTALLLLAITGLALLLRVYRLDTHSVWSDEYNYCLVPVPGVWNYVRLMHLWGPDNLPLYYILYHPWCHFFGITIIKARMLTVVCSLPCIPLAFLVGRRVFGASAGWIAAVCVAVSPFQIWHAHSMRPFGLCMPLALLGMYALLRARTSFRWYGVALAANVAMMWLQVFSVFVFPVQALFLLGIRPHGFRRALGWSLLQVLVILPAFLWLLPRMSYVPDAEYDHYVLPPISRVVVDLVGDDVIRWSSEFRVAAPKWTEACPRFETWSKVSGASLMVLFAVLGLATLRIAMGRWRGGDSGPALVLAMAFLPMLMLLCLAYVWRPCIETRHTSYCSAALYIAAAGAIVSLRRPVFRYVLVAIMVGLLSLEAALYLPAMSRTDRIGAARYIQANQTPDDIILVKGIIPYAREAFRACQQDTSIPVISAHTIEAVCLKTEAFFEQLDAANETAQVWAAIEMPFQSRGRLEGLFRNRLAYLGVSGDYRIFRGMGEMMVCRFARTGPPDAGALEPEELAPSFTDYDAILDALDMGSKERKPMEDALRRIIDLPLPLGKLMFQTVSLLASEEHEYALAQACARRSVAMLPTFGPGHLALGIALAGSGDVPSACEAFDRAFQEDRVVRKLYGELVNALYEEPDQTTALEQLSQYADTGFPYSVLRRLYRAQFPDAAAPDPGMSAKDPLFCH